MSQSELTWEMDLSHAPKLVNIAAASYEEPRSERRQIAEWCIHFYKHDGTLLLDDAEIQLAPGSIGLIPPDVSHELDFRGRSEHLFAHFRLAGVGGERVRVAAVQDFNRSFAGMLERFEHAMHCFQARPAQAEARLWDLLWEVAERSNQVEPRRSRRHAALDSACRVIQARLSEPLSLSDLATPAGVSPAHLTRLFRAELGLTATDYLRRCRLERALHLLTRSQLPVKEVACEVGIPDLHAFNKAVRRGYGVSPRALRARGAAEVSASPAFLTRPLGGATVAEDNRYGS